MERRRRETLEREIEVAKKEHEDKVKEKKAKTKNDVTDGGKTVHQGEDDKNKNRVCMAKIILPPHFLFLSSFYCHLL